MAILLVAFIYIFGRLLKEKAKSRKLKKIENELFQKGNTEQINPDLLAEEQAELLPYDKSFEVHRDNIKIGKYCVQIVLLQWLSTTREHWIDITRV